MSSTVAPSKSRPTRERSLRVIAGGAVAGPVLFTASWLVLGFVSDGYTLFGHTFAEYSPVSQPISGLGMGETAPYMNAAFVATGVMLAVGSVAAVLLIDPAGSRWRNWVAGLLACTGVGQAIDGVFDLEHGTVHGIGFLLALGTPAVSFVLAAGLVRRVRGWVGVARGLRWAAVVNVLLVVAFFSQFTPTAEGAEQGAAGLLQRLAVLHVHAWFVMLAWKALRAQDHPLSP